MFDELASQMAVLEAKLNEEQELRRNLETKLNEIESFAYDSMAYEVIFNESYKYIM